MNPYPSSYFLAPITHLGPSDSFHQHEQSTYSMPQGIPLRGTNSKKPWNGPRRISIRERRFSTPIRRESKTISRFRRRVLRPVFNADSKPAPQSNGQWIVRAQRLDQPFRVVFLNLCDTDSCLANRTKTSSLFEIKIHAALGSVHLPIQ